MAAIDKTYLNNWNKFDTVRNWALNQSFKLKNGKTIYLKDYMYYPDLTKKEWDDRHDESIKYAEKVYNNPKYIAQHKELYGNDWEFNAEDFFDVVLWNTPVYVDIWLIRNCPFDFIQDRLKEQYGGGYSKEMFTNHNEDDLYEQIKNRTSIYDIYRRNGLGKKAKVLFYDYHEGNLLRDKKLVWFIEVNPYWYKNKHLPMLESMYSYNEDDDMWYSDEEAMPWTSSMANKKGTLTKKNIINLVRKWNLPKNTYIKFLGRLKEKNNYYITEFLVRVY